MHTNEIGLIAMDMDGTLLDSHQRISRENLRALKQARAQGVRLAICSGRLPGDVAIFLLENGLEDCAILSLNGAYCLRSPLGEAFANHVLTDAALEAAVRILWDARLTFGCFAQNRLAIFEGAMSVEDETWGTNTTGPCAPEYLYGGAGLEEARRTGVNKLLCVAGDEAVLADVRRRLEGVEGLDVTSSWKMNLELMPAGVGKGSAVKELAESLGLIARQVMAFGDYDNDESMIAYAGLGVAMANATQSVKNAAKLITLSNDENGVAWAVERRVLLRP